MPEEDGLTHEQQAFESALGALAPAAAMADRDRLMFHAGRAAAGRAKRLWQSAAAVLAIGLCLSLILHEGWPAPPSPARQVELARSIEPESSPFAVPAGDHYIRLRQLLLKDGVAALTDRRDAITFDTGNQSQQLARLLEEQSGSRRADDTPPQGERQ